MGVSDKMLFVIWVQCPFNAFALGVNGKLAELICWDRDLVAEALKLVKQRKINQLH